MHWFDAHSGATQAVSTIVLVIVTTWYVVLTRNIAKASRDAQRAYVFIDLVPFTDTLFELHIANDGTRSAMDLQFRIVQSSSPALQEAVSKLRPVESGVRYLAPKRVYKYRFHLDNSEGGSIFDDEERAVITLQLSYRDEQQAHTETNTIDLTALEGVQLSSFADAQEGIRIAIERLAQSLPNPQDPFQRFWKSTCPWCRSEISAGAKKCPQCLEWINPDPQSSAESPTLTDPGTETADEA